MLNRNMPPKRKTQIVRGRTKGKSRKAQQERLLEKEQEAVGRDDVERPSDDDSLSMVSLSSDSSSSIASENPWQKKTGTTTASPSSDKSMPESSGHPYLYAMIPSSVISNKISKKEKKQRGKSIDSMSDDSRQNETKIKIKVKVAIGRNKTREMNDDNEKRDDHAKSISKLSDSDEEKKNDSVKNGKHRIESDDIQIRKKRVIDKSKNIKESKVNSTSSRSKVDDMDSIPKKDAIPKKVLPKDTNVSLLDKSVTAASSLYSSKILKISSKPASGRVSSGSNDNGKNMNGTKNENGRYMHSKNDRDTINSSFPPRTINQEENGNKSKSSISSKNENAEKLLDDLSKAMDIFFNASKDKDSDDESEQRYDFFDRDKDGKIIEQPWIPMFPEDFSTRKQWSLSWWGIVEPPRELMYPEAGGGYPCAPYPNQRNLTPPYPPMKGKYPPPEGNQPYPPNNYNHTYNYPNFPPNHHPRPPHGHEGWGRSNPMDSRGFENRDRGGWQNRPINRGGPPGHGNFDQWGKEYGPNPQFRDEKRRHR